MLALFYCLYVQLCLFLSFQLISFPFKEAVYELEKTLNLYELDYSNYVTQKKKNS